MQLLRRAAAHAAETAQDDVALQFIDHVLDPSLSEKLIELQLDHGLRHRADGQQHEDHAEQNQKRVKDAARAAQRVNFAVADRGDGGQRHVERVEHRVMLDEDEARACRRPA